MLGRETSRNINKDKVDTTFQYISQALIDGMIINIQLLHPHTLKEVINSLLAPCHFPLNTIYTTLNEWMVLSFVILCTLIGQRLLNRSIFSRSV